MTITAAACLLVTVLTGCSEPDPRQAREVIAGDDSKDIVVGVTWPFEHAKGTLKNGIEMAQDEINGQGGILGRKLRLEFADDQRSVDEGMIIAQEFAENPEIMAVLGHLDTYIAAPAATTYAFNDLLMISPGAVGMPLTENDHDLVFRSLPNSEQGVADIARYIADSGHKRVMVYYVNNTYGRDLANFFEEEARELGFDVPDRRAYAALASGHQRLLQEWHDYYEFDAIFLAGSLPESADIIRLARETGIDVPVIGGAGLDSPELIEAGGQDVEGVVVASIFHPNLPGQQVQQFAEAYEERFGKPADASAANGYDTLRLLAHAMEKAGSPLSREVADTLRGLEPWRGVTGEHQFTGNGNLVKPHVNFNIVREGVFELAD